MDDLTVAQAAAELGVSPRRVRQYIDAGRLKAKAITPRLFTIRRADLAKLKRLPRGRPVSKK